jgi:hypothetical protein
MELTPRQLFERTKNNPELRKAEQVILYACQLGAGSKDSFAQRYADLTGKTVYAPTKDLWVDKQGNFFSAGALPKSTPNELPQPNLKDMGEIKMFRPIR